MERFRNRYAKKLHTSFQALLYNSIYCFYSSIKILVLSIENEYFIKWICKKFDIGAEDNVVRDFERENHTLIDAEKQVKI